MGFFWGKKITLQWLVGITVAIKKKLKVSVHDKYVINIACFYFMQYTFYVEMIHIAAFFRLFPIFLFNCLCFVLNTTHKEPPALCDTNDMDIHEVLQVWPLGS